MKIALKCKTIIVAREKSSSGKCQKRLHHYVTKNQTEYFNIENRNKKGRDVSLPASGLAIWSVDEFGNNSNEQMMPNKYCELSLDQADNRFDFELRRSLIGDADETMVLSAKLFKKEPEQ